MAVTGYDETKILRDEDGNPIPQIYDPVEGEFVPFVYRIIYGAGDGNRPATGQFVAQGFFSIETQRLWLWDGSDWVEV